MAQQYGVDPDDLEGLPPLASPLMASGVDPDEAKLAMFGGKPGPVSMSPSAATAGAAGGAGAATSVPTNPVGSAGAVSPVPAAPSASGAGGGLTNLQLKAFQQGMSTGNQEMDTANKEGQVPDNIAQLQQKKITDEAAAPLASDYKPSFGQRVVRGLRGALVGGLTGGIPGLLVGATMPGQVPGGTAYGAPTDAYDLALNAQKQSVAGDTESLANAQANFKQQQDALAARQKGLTDAGTAFGTVAKGVTEEQNAQTDAAKLPILQENADTEKQKAWNESPEGKLKLTQGEIDQRTAIADRNRMPPGFMRSRYILTGEMQPAHEPSGEEIALGQATQAFVRENGHPPRTLADYQKVVSAAKGGTGSSASDKGADANLRATASNAKAVLNVLLSQKTKEMEIAQWTADDEAKLKAAQQAFDDAQSKLSGGAGSGKSAPPDSLLGKTAEGGYVYGQNGERWQKVKGKWAQ